MQLDQKLHKYNPDKIIVGSTYDYRQNLLSEFDHCGQGKPYYDLDTPVTFSNEKIFSERYLPIGISACNKAKNNIISSIEHNLEQRNDLLRQEIRKSIHIESGAYMQRRSRFTTCINKKLGSHTQDLLRQEALHPTNTILVESCHNYSKIQKLW